MFHTKLKGSKGTLSHSHSLSLSLSHKNGALIEEWIGMGCKMYVITRYIGNMDGWMDDDDDDDDDGGGGGDDANVVDDQCHCLMR